MAKKKGVLNKLDALLVNATTQLSKENIDNRLKENIQLFKSIGASFIDEYVDYSAKDLCISSNNDKTVNLKNQHDNTLVYPDNPMRFCEEQVDVYINNPCFVTQQSSLVNEDFFFQPRYENDIKKPVLDKLNAFKGDIKKPIGLCLVYGCGLGFHLLALIKKLDIRHLCIIDNDKDSFYASLNVFEWQKIIAAYQGEGRSLSLYIGQDPSHTLICLRHLILEQGLHHTVNMLYYQHLNSASAQHFYQAFVKDFNMLNAQVGFFEDEHLSLSHTFKNIESGLNVLDKLSPLDKAPPVFILGNGPSLDMQINFIKQYQQNALVISCGSTIGSLYKAGIVPDIHLEMERTKETYDLNIQLTDKAYCQQISCIGLNAVYHRVFALFKQSVMLTKSFDAGGRWLNTLVKTPLPILHFANPTCVNTALSLCLSLGMSEIYLLGIDLGMKDEAQHHASISQYYDDEVDMLYGVERATMTVPANFGGEVKTTYFLNLCRATIEMLLAHSQKANVYNLNDGALIEGTQPLSIDKARECLSTLLPVDKKAFRDGLLQSHFSPIKGFDSHIEKDKIIKELNIIKQILQKSFLPDSIVSLNDLLTAIDSGLKNIRQLHKTSPLAWHYLNGSVLSFCHLLYFVCMMAESDVEMKREYTRVVNIIERFKQDCVMLIDSFTRDNHGE